MAAWYPVKICQRQPSNNQAGGVANGVQLGWLNQLWPQHLSGCGSELWLASMAVIILYSPVNSGAG